MDSQDNSQVGKWGEETAVAYLESHGYSILERNWRNNHQEVDIIAQEGDTVVIVEVKTRTTTFISPVEAVNKQKQKLLFSAANSYVRQKNLDCEIRFDIVSIVAVNGSVDIEHIENAFYPKIH